MEKKFSDSFWGGLIGAGLILFCLNVFLHYFSQRPLWNDEQCIFDNIRYLSMPKIFGPLIHIQVFPRLYLAGIKFISDKFNSSLLVLRLPSLLCMLAAFFLWSKAYRETLYSKKLYALAIFAFAASYRLTYYAAELKHYSMDVLAVVIVLFFCFYQNRMKMKSDDSWGILLSMLTPFLILLSYAAIFVFWMPTYNFLLMARKDRRFLLIFLVSLLAVVIAAVLSYMVDLRYSVNMEGLKDYWPSLFIRTDSLTGFFSPLTEGIKKMVVYWGGTLKWQRHLFMIFIPFFLYGLLVRGISVWWKDRGRIDDPGSMGFVIFCELFILALLQKYPFTGSRVTLFFAPFVFYFILWGIDHLKAASRVKNAFFIYFFCYNLMCAVNTLGVYIRLYQ